MSIVQFEVACVIVVIATLAAMSRARPLREILARYAPLAIAAWAGEASSVAIHGYYFYSPHWHARVASVPILVPLIWPLVVMSARDVAGALWPDLRAARPFIAGAIVMFDASLVEVIAVRARLWWWVEPGHLGVPLAGIAGWGLFALSATFIEEKAPPKARAIAVALGAPVLTQALIVASWWALFRWGLRRDLGSWALGALGIVSIGAAALVLRARRKGRAIPLAIAGPRMLAAVLFFALLAVTAPSDAMLWAHTAAVAVPYLAATSFAKRLMAPSETLY